MTEETNVLHALRWWRRLRPLAESRLDHAVARRSASAAVRPARGTGDLANVAERLLAEWYTAGTAAIAADLQILDVGLQAFSDQLAAKDREQGGGTLWAGEAAAAAAYLLAPATSPTGPRSGPRRAVDGVGERPGGTARLARCASAPAAQCPGDEHAVRRARRGRAATWLIDRDLDAVALPLDSWILVAEPDHDARTTSTPLLGTPEWVAADEEARNATFALYVIACLAEREPVVIAARLAAEIAAERSAYLVVALRQGSQTISEGHVLPPPAEALPMDRHVRRGTSWNRPDRARTASFCGGSVRQHAAKPSGGLVRLVRPLEVAAGRDRAP